MSEEKKKSEVESRAPSAVSFIQTPDDKIFTEISEKVVKSRLTKNKNSVNLIFKVQLSSLSLQNVYLQECFVDKGRQMSVMMGNKDLCTNLKLQEKKKRYIVEQISLLSSHMM